MTSSKSNSWFARALVLLAVLVLGTGVANAERKRLVVMEFDGDEAEDVRKSFVKFLKKTHTVIKTDKWTSAADEMGAAKVTDANVKKVAKKLKVDGVITANVEKRRDEYIIRIKLRSGSNGKLVGSQVNIKSDAPKLNKEAKSNLEDELFGMIGGLESVRAGGEEEEEEEEKPAKEDKPSKFGGKQMETEEEEEKPAKLSKKEEEKKKKEEEAARKEEEKRAKEEEKKRKDAEKAALASKKDKEEAAEEKEEEAEENPLPKPKKNDKKKVAKREEEEEEGIEEEVEVGAGMSRSQKKSPGQRAIDAVAGVSFSMRRLSFTYDTTIGQRPAGYKGKPVPGGMFDVAVYPLAFGDNQSMLRNIGVTMMYDQVLLVKSEAPNGTELKSAQSRFAAGVQFRYPFSKSATSPVIGARVRYGRQAFKIQAPANGLPPVPNVNDTIIDPGVFFKYPLNEKLVLSAQVSFLAVTNTGQMQNTMQGYGAATVSGFEGSAGADYQLTRLIFLRGNIGFETIGFKFNDQNAARRDGGKVKGARDSYFGAAVTAGYLF